MIVTIASPSATLQNAVIYCRISSVKQDEASIVTQLHNCYDHLKKENFNITKIYVDKAQSAYSDNSLKRKCFSKLLEDAEKREFDVICCRDRERFSRADPFDSVDVENSLGKIGVKVMLLNNKLPEPKSMIERIIYDLVKKIDSYTAFSPSEKNSENVKNSLYKHINEGYWSGGTPFGYQLEYSDKDRHRKPFLVPNDNEAIVVKMIFNMYANESTIAEIRRNLEANNFHPRWGRKWLQPMISRMLGNELYIGIVSWDITGKGIAKATCKPLIDTETWSKVQARRERQKCHGARMTDSQRSFSSLIFCSDCGSTFKSYPNKKVKVKGRWVYSDYRYKCSCTSGNFYRKETRECHNKIKVQEEWLERKIYQLIFYQFTRHRKNSKKFAREFDIETPETTEIVEQNTELIKINMGKEYEKASRKISDKRDEITEEIKAIDKQIKQHDNAIDRYYREFEAGRLQTIPTDRIDKLNDFIRALQKQKLAKDTELTQTPAPIPFPSFVEWLESRLVDAQNLKGRALREFLHGLGFRAVVHSNATVDLEFSTLGYRQTELARQSISLPQFVQKEQQLFSRSYISNNRQRTERPASKEGFSFFSQKNVYN
ncbi:MAG: recombinase family protein [Candidatus Riflebacteria bacterium]|nr:recombinase family protein [Candidatus Riflebacteria bacterium]